MNLSSLPSKELMPGYHAKHVYGERISWLFWDVDPMAEVPEHHHPNEQIMHVVSGVFEFTLDGEKMECRPGDVIMIPPNTPHSGKALTPCKLMDVFSPVRETYK